MKWWFRRPQTLHLPLALVPVLAAVWPAIDIGHTICTVTGDLVGTAVVASQMKTLNRSVFDGPRTDPDGQGLKPASP